MTPDEIIQELNTIFIDVFEDDSIVLNEQSTTSDIEAWDSDSMKKDYYRYRLSKGKPLLYNKIITRSVPSEKLTDAAF